MTTVQKWILAAIVIATLSFGLYVIDGLRDQIEVLAGDTRENKTYSATVLLSYYVALAAVGAGAIFAWFIRIKE